MDGDVFLCETVLHLLLSLPVFKPSIVKEGFFSWLPHVLFKESLIVELLINLLLVSCKQHPMYFASLLLLLFRD